MDISKKSKAVLGLKWGGRDEYVIVSVVVPNVYNIKMFVHC